MKEYFYYFRDEANRPVVTVCILKGAYAVARGVSICSFKDMPCKRRGKAIARGRAHKAFIREKSGDLVERQIAREVLVVAGLTKPVHKSLYFMLINYGGKYVFNPKLTEHEEALLNQKETKP